MEIAFKKEKKKNQLNITLLHQVSLSFDCLHLIESCRRAGIQVTLALCSFLISSWIHPRPDVF